MAMIKLTCMFNVELLSFVRQFEDNVNTCEYSYQYMGESAVVCRQRTVQKSVQMRCLLMDTPDLAKCENQPNNASRPAARD